MKLVLTALSANFLVSLSYSSSVKGWMDCCCTLIVKRGYTEIHTEITDKLIISKYIHTYRHILCHALSFEQNRMFKKNNVYILKFWLCMSILTMNSNSEKGSDLYKISCLPAPVHEMYVKTINSRSETTAQIKLERQTDKSDYIIALYIHYITL